MSIQRRGSSLLEILVVITLLSAALTAAATTLAALMRIEHQIRTDQFQEQSLTRLASRWRTDAHTAIAASAGGDCIFRLADGRTIRYSYAAPRVVREVRHDDEIIHRDAFVLLPRAQVGFSLAGDSRQSLVRLSVCATSDPAPAYSAAVRPAEFEAALNLHDATRPQENTP